jgi:ethanolamine phosphate transferase 2 subunit G
LQNESACLVRLKANLPTVTKPRIKALTSGTVPSFLDVVRNFGKGEIGLDTFLHQMNLKNEKIVFSGDDTWVNLFNFFHRQYANQDSLFVNDFYEGDKKITNSIQIELSNSDWSMLILHYLGLDHMGHVFIEGPFHELVSEKLNEMDNVIKMIYTKLVEWNRQSKTKSLLFVTSDHGMRDSGINFKLLSFS